MEPVTKPPTASPSGKFISRQRKWLLGSTACVYFILLTIFLFVPDPFWFLGSDSQSKELADSDWLGYLMHGTAFGILTILLLALAPRTTLTAVLTCVVVVLIYAAATEYVQQLIPTRSATVLDFGADALGMGLGIIAWTKFGRYLGSES